MNLGPYLELFSHWLLFLFFELLENSNEVTVSPRPSMSCMTTRPKPCLRPINADERLELNKLCGTRKVTNSGMSIAYGEEIPFAMSPWTALLIGPDPKNEFCTLLVFSHKHAIGALHCLWDVKTEKLVHNALDHQVRFGGECLAKSTVCKDPIPQDYVYKITSIYHPLFFFKTGTQLDSFIVEVDRNFDFTGDGRPICLLSPGEDPIEEARRKWVEEICEQTSIEQSGYSGITINNPSATHGKLHKINSKFSEQYQGQGDQFLIESLQHSNQTNRPTTVRGDSGGPAYCRAKNTPSSLKRTVLIGNLKAAQIKHGQIVHGEDVLTFSPFYWKVFCPAKITNACFANTNNWSEKFANSSELSRP